MSIFALLGIILDSISNGDVILENNAVCITDIDTISAYVMPLCTDQVGECYHIIENGRWYQVVLTFSKDTFCHRGILQSIRFENSEGDAVTCDVAENILNELTEKCADEIYFEICDRIMF